MSTVSTNEEKIKNEVDEMGEIKLTIANLKSYCQELMTNLKSLEERKKKKLNELNKLDKETRRLNGYSSELEKQFKFCFQNYNAHNRKMESLKGVYLGLMERLPKLESELKESKIDFEKSRLYWKTFCEQQVSVLTKQEEIYNSIGWAANYKQLYDEKELLEGVKLEKENQIVELTSKTEKVENEIQEIIRDELPWSKTCILFAETMLKNTQIAKSSETIEREIKKLSVGEAENMPELQLSPPHISATKTAHIKPSSFQAKTLANIPKPPPDNNIAYLTNQSIETKNPLNFVVENVVAQETRPKTVDEVPLSKYMEIETEASENSDSFIHVNIDEQSQASGNTAGFDAKETENQPIGDQDMLTETSFPLVDLSRRNIDNSSDFMQKILSVNYAEQPSDQSSMSNYLNMFASSDGDDFGNFLNNFGAKNRSPSGGSVEGFTGFPFNFSNSMQQDNNESADSNKGGTGFSLFF